MTSSTHRARFPEPHIRPGVCGTVPPTRRSTGIIRCAEGGGGLPDLWAIREGSTRLGEPGELIAAIPAMLGFRPERSMVLAVLGAEAGNPGGAVIDLVVRFDLAEQPAVPSTDTAPTAAAAARVCAHPGVVGVLVVVVDDRPPPAEPSGGASYPELAELARLLATHGVPIRGAWAVPAIEPGRTWRSMCGPRRCGPVQDPAASPVALSHVLDGRPIRRGRTELTALVAVDTELRERMAVEIPGATDRAHEHYAAAARAGNPLGYSRRALEQVLWQISNVDSGARLPPRELADIAVALRDRRVRDTMFAVAATVHADAAEQLWIRLTRAASAGDRAESAALLGYFAYVRGDGPFAGIALDIALEADPDHSMAVLLHTALISGMRPERLRELVRCGRETAADLGIDLGPEQ
ncbi:DUF4192 domain-containing protein [Nocardia paucivorans]|uniref:DUF4192 domain-containing protein n=1 Tax=Nocardia paucivorans TaxID=114259 RepID=UPI0002E1BB99|nr:DUF4192 domain-containing protein [Nocardia paucivorans]